MLPKEKLFVLLVSVFVLGTIAGAFVVQKMYASPMPPNGVVACTMEAKICPDGSAVGRTGPTCEFAACPTTGDTSSSGGGGAGSGASGSGTITSGGGSSSGGGEPTICPMDALACPDGSYVSRSGPNCEFAICPSQSSSGGQTGGQCTNDANCAKGYSCVDISPVAREGYQNLRCWQNGAPRPICLSGNTEIATPRGETIVKNIHGGDMVWSVNTRGEKIVVPVLIAAHTQVPKDHHVVHLILADGRELFVSPGHKVADGRTIGSLQKGDTLDGSPIASATLIPYDQEYTYDILPGGDTGIYFAGGILLQSTLK